MVKIIEVYGQNGSREFCALINDYNLVQRVFNVSALELRRTLAHVEVDANIEHSITVKKYFEKYGDGVA